MMNKEGPMTGCQQMRGLRIQAHRTSSTRQHPPPHTTNLHHVGLQEVVVVHAAVQLPAQTAALEGWEDQELGQAHPAAGCASGWGWVIGMEGRFPPFTCTCAECTLPHGCGVVVKGIRGEVPNGRVCRLPARAAVLFKHCERSGYGWTMSGMGQEQRAYHQGAPPIKLRGRGPTYQPSPPTGHPPPPPPQTGWPPQCRTGQRLAGGQRSP
jgi:hypothetical protein